MTSPHKIRPEQTDPVLRLLALLKGVNLATARRPGHRGNLEATGHGRRK